MYHQEYNSIGSHLYNGIVYTDFDYPAYNFHDSYELLYIMDGELFVTVSATEIQLTKGDLMLIAPNTLHNWRKTGHNKFFCAVFSGDFLSEFSKKDIDRTFLKFNITEDVEKFLHKNLFYTGTPEFYMLKGCLYTICSQCALFTTKNERSNKSDTNFVLEVNNYIIQNIDTNFTQKEIAEALNYEYHYFSTLFNKYFRVGLKKYTNNFRFKTACRLLTTTDDKIAQIANDCGFSSIRSFNRVFKELSGLTPNEYRNSKTLTKVSSEALETYPKWQ